ncbi:MAG: helix-turn-helix domain-containing protein [Ferruginibacter sp.]
MYNQANFSMANQTNESFLFNLYKFEENCFFGQIQRNNFFSLIWVKEGSGKVKTGFSEFDFQGNTLFAFAPFQPFIFSTENAVKGVVINFHPEFMFIHRHEKEKAFKEVLYNNANQAPFVNININSTSAFEMLCENIEAEMKNPSLAQYDLLVAYLRIFLINASRLKMEQQQLTASSGKEGKEHQILQKLKDAIEENFRAKHSPGDYAAMLYVTTKTLAKVSKLHYNKTLSNIINERIIIEAKRELYLTNKAVKEIAYELGYEDEYYFSRFFKVNTNVSPQKYRENVTYTRA